ncbi:MAG: hypothetical protein ACT4RN_17530 [Pseudonocardia sp.]
MSPRRRPPLPWPWPADTALERARRVAQAYRAQLLELAPDRAARLDAELRDRGQGWVCARRLALDADELIGVPMAAQLCEVSERTIDKWADEGLRSIRTDDGVRYRVGDLLGFQAARRRRRLIAWATGLLRCGAAEMRSC